MLVFFFFSLVYIFDEFLFKLYFDLITLDYTYKYTLTRITFKISLNIIEIKYYIFNKYDILLIY